MQSRFDHTREPVGKIYRDAQIYGEKRVEIGDLSREMTKSLVNDLNDAIRIGRKEFEGRQFYITVAEKRDLMMKNAFIRRLIKTKYRPYPEANTIVFKHVPNTDSTYFCWELPERHHMKNMLACPEIFDPQTLQKLKDWERFRLEKFGFICTENHSWKEDPLYVGDTLISHKETPRISVVSESKHIEC